MTYELIDHKEFAQKMRDKGAPDYVIYLADHAQEIEGELVLRAEREFLESLIVKDFPEDTVYRYKD